MIERHTAKVHNKLKNASVAIAGLGGLGSNIAVSLARSGVGHLFLVDFDRVDITNINRQQYFVDQVGMYKTEALKSTIEKINPYINIEIKTICVNEKNVLSLFGEYNIVCEAFDRAQNKAMLVNTLLENTNSYVVSASGMAGYLSSNTIKTKKLMKRLYLCGDGETDSADVNGLMAPRVAICANHQANAVLRIICGEFEV